MQCNLATVIDYHVDPIITKWSRTEKGAGQAILEKGRKESGERACTGT